MKICTVLRIGQVYYRSERTSYCTISFFTLKNTVLYTHAFNLSILTIYISCAAKNQRIELVFICIPAKKWYRRYRAVPGYILIWFMCPPFSPNYFLLLFFVLFVIFNFFLFDFFICVALRVQKLAFFLIVEKCQLMKHEYLRTTIIKNYSTIPARNR